MLRTRSVALLLVAGAVIGAGCGGGGDDEDNGSSDTTAAAGGATPTTPPMPEPTTAPDATPEEAAFCEEAVPVFDVDPATADGEAFMHDLAASMEGIEPPAELAETWDAYIAGLHEGGAAEDEAAMAELDQASAELATFMQDTCGMFAASPPPS